MARPTCPSCGKPAEERRTRYGVRHSCCGLHSWGGRPLVSQAVHDARQRAHAAFDPLWQRAEEAYQLAEPAGPERDQAVKRIRRTARNRAYEYISHVTGMPEPECHMSAQDDLAKLAAIEAVALGASPAIVRAWWKSRGEAA
ncbi:hypothetical protein ACTZWW_04440 [Salinarimonas sp. NSM]|uniref:hypothetical protein n=1 Tax=Salinarimonas sp. NSM TaxID=3458003 RepID=UPI0040373C3B